MISWRHVLQAKSKLKPGCAIGTDGLDAEVVQCLSVRGTDGTNGTNETNDNG